MSYIKSNYEVQGVIQSKNYIIQFAEYIYQETGLRKESFTSAGVQNHLKTTAKKFYQLNIHGEVLRKVICLAKLFTDVTGLTYSKIEEKVIALVNILWKIAEYFVKSYIGRGLLFITVGTYLDLAWFIGALYFVAMFVVSYLSNIGFLKLKEWILYSLRHEKFRAWFDSVFGTFGRPIMAA